MTLAGADIQAIAVALADELEARGLLTPAASAGRVLNVAQVCELLGRSDQWVYAHAKELGAFRYGTGRRARVGFDLESIERYKRDHRVGANEPKPKPARRAAGRKPRGTTNLIPVDEDQ